MSVRKCTFCLCFSILWRTGASPQQSAAVLQSSVEFAFPNIICIQNSSPHESARQSSAVRSSPQVHLLLVFFYTLAQGRQSAAALQVALSLHFLPLFAYKIAVRTSPQGSPQQSATAPFAAVVFPYFGAWAPVRSSPQRYSE